MKKAGNSEEWIGAIILLFSDLVSCNIDDDKGGSSNDNSRGGGDENNDSVVFVLVDCDSDYDDVSFESINIMDAQDIQYLAHDYYKAVRKKKVVMRIINKTQKGNTEVKYNNAMREKRIRR